MSNEFELSRLALRLLTETECKAVVSDPDLKVAEWETQGYTFFASERHLAILRTAAMGGDMREIHGGWKYVTPFGMWREFHEIKSLERAFAPRKRT